MNVSQLTSGLSFPRLSALLLGLVLAFTGPLALAGTITLYYPDAQGNPIAAADINGNILWRKHFTPYGKELNGVPDDIGYTGHEFDQETGLTYMQARYYDPIGRFLSPDPVGFNPNQPMTFNRYSYANNNPYKYTDPNGESVDTIIDVGYVVYDAGQFLGAATAASVGAVTGDQYLQAAGLDGMQATGTNLGTSAASLAVPGLSAPMIRGGINVVDAAGDVAKDAQAASKAFSKEKQALVEMAKADKKTGITSEDLQAYKNLNKELPDPFPTNKVRGPESHSSGASTSQEKHGHVGPVNHIPIKDPEP